MKPTITSVGQTMHSLGYLGFKYHDAVALRKISMTLRRWFELECGDGTGCIERDEKTGKTFWLSATTRFVQANDPRSRMAIADRETAARKRLDKIMADYPGVVPYIQTDPRGCALWILRKSDVKEGESLDQIYTRGTAIV